jgi:hypothetical protein
MFASFTLATIAKGKAVNGTDGKGSGWKMNENDCLPNGVATSIVQTLDGSTEGLIQK